MKEHDFIVVVVDAVIGAGKTTIIRKCLIPTLTKKGWRITEVREPVDKWKENGRLDLFYKDPARRGFQFQTVAFHDRVREAQEKFHRYKHSTDVFLLERSIFTDVLFTKMLYESGTIDKTEYEDYLNLWKMWEEVMPFKPDLFIYLKPDLDVCMERLKERNRSEETGVSLEYQRKLEEKHQEFLGDEFVAIGDCHYVPRLLLNTNSNFRDDPKIQEQISSMIEQEFKNIRSRRRK